ncbi:MAG: PAS domain S-box protein, partial [Prosthecobacter sp.]|nr:PAS domain S-box protein [Prosthecobacter sp.]
MITESQPRPESPAEIDRAARQRDEEARRQLAAIVESSDDAIISKTLEGRITSWNLGAERMFGYAAEEAIGKPITLLIPPERLDEEATIIGRIRRGELTEHYETVRLRKDGSPVHVSVTVSPLRDRDGNIVGASKIARDITERIRTEAELRQRSQILEVLNSVSGTLVAQRDLEKIIQSVTDASREISGAAFGAFFYNVTNEQGEAFTLHTLSGAPKEDFAKFPTPRDTALFGPAFRGEGVVRIGDVLKDPRYGQNAPNQGMLEDHPPVRSYLAVPVVSNSGKVLGGMFFGHPKPYVFTESSEAILVALAAQAAIAIDNADLYSSLQRELVQVKRVRNELRASEGRWRQLAEAMPHLVWTAGPDGNWDFVSPQWCAYTGRGETEQRDLGWTEVIHPEDRAGFESAWNVAAHARGILDVEVRILRSDGVYRWFKTRAVPVTDEAGNILKWYGSNTDIEDIKRTDVALRENESRLSALFAQAGSGIIQTDLEGRIVMVNDAYCEIVARNREEVLGMRIHDLTHPEDRLLHQEPFDNMMRGGPAFIIEKRDMRPDGTAVWVRDSVVGIRDSEGHVTAGLTIALDITDSREAELELEQARDRALAAVREKDEFLARLSHELRTPLSPVLLLASEGAANSG